MDLMMRAPSMSLLSLQIVAQRLLARLELWLEAERDQLALWVPVALGTGIVAWFQLPNPRAWIGVIMLGVACAGCGVALGLARRLGRVMCVAGLLVSLGCSLAWVRASSVAAPVLARPVVAQFSGTVTQIEVQGARDRVRLTLAPNDPGLPPAIRVNVDTKDAPMGLVAGEQVRLRARLLPPPGPALPGGYNFARSAWFQQLGATGRAFGPVARIGPLPAQRDTWHDRLTRLLLKRMPGSPGGIGASFISGDRGAISPADENSMRASGLTHLVSVSGLHITVAVTGTLLLTLRLLAFFPFIALRVPVMTVAAIAGALLGIFYTIITGAEFPTIRSCVAALLVIAGIVLGREAITLRLVATGALVILLLWPEALMGPSFQLSFIAVTSIIAYNEHPFARRLSTARDGEGLWHRLGREGLALVVTGLVVEAALAPIAFFHFHRSGIYGAFANLIGIPLTTFFIMPMEALGLIFEPTGLSAPFWWCANLGLHILIGLSDRVAALPGAVTMLPEVPLGAFALVSYGGLWLMLWRTRARFMGLVPVGIGLAWAIMMPTPDLLITGDGRHMLLHTQGRQFEMLRDRAHDFVRTQMAERVGYNGPLSALDDDPRARCNDDLCLVRIDRGGRTWSILATRSTYRLPWEALVRTCSAVDIVVSDRYLPSACHPRWIKADRGFMRQSGGLAIDLAHPQARQTLTPDDEHPWVIHATPSPHRRALPDDIGS